MPKRRSLLFLLLTFYSTSFFGFQLELTEENNKLGVRDTADQVQLLANEYDAIGWGKDKILYEGLIKAKKNERWALFNEKGDRITAHDYIQLEPFGSNQFIASKRSTSSILQVFGTINKKGKALIPFGYVRIDKDGDRLITTEKGDKAFLKGLFNAKGEKIIDPEFLDITPLNNGYYSVENTDNLLALFDSVGKAITNFQFQEIKRIGASTFEVSYYNRKGAIDRAGKVVIPAIYETLKLTNGQAIGKTYNQWTYFSQNSQTELFFDDINALSDSLLLVSTNKDIGVVKKDKSHQLYLRQHLIHESTKNLAKIQNLENNYFGVIGPNGKLILPTIYDSISLSDKYALGKIERANGENWFAFDMFGKRLNMIGYEKVKGRIGGYTIVERNGKEALLATSGKELTPFEYSFTEATTNDQFIVESNNGLGILDNRGTWLVTPYKDSIEFRDSHYFFKQGSAQGFIDLNGKTLARSYDNIELLPLGYAKNTDEGIELYSAIDSLLFDYKYDTVYSLNNRHWYLQRDDLKFFYRPEDDKVFELPERIDSLGEYQEGYISFYKNGQWGFLDETAQLRISNRYEAVSHFSEALCPVKLIGKWGVINRAENLVVQPKYDSITPFYNALAIVKDGVQYGLMDRTGRMVLNLQYDEIQRHAEWIRLKKDNKIGISDVRGRLIRSPQFDEVKPLGQGHFLVRKRNRFGVIDSSGRDLVPLTFESIKKVSSGFLAVRPAETKTYQLK